jgi:imidazolonepropionase-like amidohydrolase
MDLLTDPTNILSNNIVLVMLITATMNLKGHSMGIVYVSMLSLFIIILSLSKIINDIPILAEDLTTYDDESLSSLPETGNKTLVLYGATLIDGTGAAPETDSVIFINNSKIFAVTNQSAFLEYLSDDNDSQISERVVLNLTGKYIMPGLFDMHAHVAGVLKDSFDQDISENTLGKLLDYGVTTIRNPGGPTNESVALKDKVLNETMRGPEIFTAGRLLNTPELQVPFVEKQVTSEEEVREEVRRQVAVGVDYIKLYVGLKPDLVKAAIDEAHNQRIKVVGHLYLTSWTDAANLGIDFLTHGVPVSPFLLSEEKQRIFNLTGGDPFDHSLWLDLVDLNSTEIKDMINILVQNQIPVDPTLSVYEVIFKQSFSDPQNEQRWNKVLQLTKMMYDSGVKILSGTDIPNFELVPGASLHRELELLIEAGISPMDVIKIATMNGAEALGLNNVTGTIEPGKEADILVPSTSPTEDIENTKKIDLVISNGKIIERFNILTAR